MKTSDDTQWTRRRFLEAAVVTAAAAKTAKAEIEPDPDRARLEALVAIYGSEIGELRKVR